MCLWVTKLSRRGKTKPLVIALHRIGESFFRTNMGLRKQCGSQDKNRGFALPVCRLVCLRTAGQEWHLRVIKCD